MLTTSRIFFLTHTHFDTLNSSEGQWFQQREVTSSRDDKKKQDSLCRSLDARRKREKARM